MIEINYTPSIPERVIEIDDLQLEVNHYGETHIKVNFPEKVSEIIPLRVIEYSSILEFEWKCECGTTLHEDAWKEKDDLLRCFNTLTDKIVLHRSRCFKNGFTVQRTLNELYDLKNTEDIAKAIAILVDILIHLKEEVRK